MWTTGGRLIAIGRILTRGQILGRNPDKSPKSYPLCYSQSPLQLCLEISNSSNSRNLLPVSTVGYCSLQRRKEEIYKTTPPSLWFKKYIQKPQVWEVSRLCPATCGKLNCTFMNSASGMIRVGILSQAMGRGIDSRNRVWNWEAKLHRLAGR